MAYHSDSSKNSRKTKSFLSQATCPTAPWTFAPPKLWVLKSWTSPRRISGCLEFERNLIQSQNETQKTKKNPGPGCVLGFQVFIVIIWWLKHTSPASFWKSPRVFVKKRLETFAGVLSVESETNKTNWSGQWFHRNFTPEVEQQVEQSEKGTVGRKDPIQLSFGMPERVTFQGWTCNHQFHVLILKINDRTKLLLNSEQIINYYSSNLNSVFSPHRISWSLPSTAGSGYISGTKFLRCPKSSPPNTLQMAEHKQIGNSCSNPYKWSYNPSSNW